MVKKDHYDQIDNSNNQYAKLKKFRICNHAIALLSTRGHHSPRNKGKPPTALCFDTAFCMYLFYHFSIKKQSNVRYIFTKKLSAPNASLLFLIFPCNKMPALFFLLPATPSVTPFEVFLKLPASFSSYHGLKFILHM